VSIVTVDSEGETWALVRALADIAATAPDELLAAVYLSAGMARCPAPWPCGHLAYFGRLSSDARARELCPAFDMHVDQDPMPRPLACGCALPPRLVSGPGPPQAPSSAIRRFHSLPSLPSLRSRVCSLALLCTVGRNPISLWLCTSLASGGVRSRDRPCDAGAWRGSAERADLCHHQVAGYCHAARTRRGAPRHTHGRHEGHSMCWPICNSGRLLGWVAAVQPCRRACPGIQAP